MVFHRTDTANSIAGRCTRVPKQMGDVLKVRHFFLQRTNRIPKDINVEPERFAAELIRRLEGVLREREAEEKLEERLKRVRLVQQCKRDVSKGTCQDIIGAHEKQSDCNIVKSFSQCTTLQSSLWEHWLKNIIRGPVKSVSGPVSEVCA
ncbi:hypothetical protein GOODEAATRI_016948 [Goodea atripinnis]|uniref:Uncharacterized protein n=1 Tax=Goodea atripinnis TaxID=208336 RepID=A0ABV0NXU0_9TELE